MAQDINAVTIVGRPTRDPEVRQVGDTQVASIRLAFSTRQKGQDGSWGDKSNYIDVAVWGRQAEAVMNYVSKGRRIGIHGRLEWREWTAQDGSKRQAVQVVAQDVQFLDSREDAPAAGGGGLPTTAPPAGSAHDDGDVPF